MNLTFQYPYWLLLVCLVVAALFTAILYYKEKTFQEQQPWLRNSLAAIRFLVLSILTILLLSPLLKSLLSETKKPVIVMAQDVSESIKNGMPESQLNTYKQDWQNLKNALNEKYQVEEISFGEGAKNGVNFDFKDKTSDLSSAISYSYDMYSNQNLGAIIMASDGIYNEGTHPMYANEKLAVPVYTIALGDTIPKKDVTIKKAYSNNIVYLGDKFSVQVDVAAKNCSGSNTTLTVSKVEGGQRRTITQQGISVNRNDFFETKEFILDADKPGIQRLVFSLSTISGEATTSNNSKEIFVEVLDARQKILVLGRSPHPDLSAINQAISSNKNYNVTVQQLGEPIRYNDFDLIILHQIPAQGAEGADVLKAIQEKRIPVWFIIGSQSNLQTLNTLQNLVIIRPNSNSLNDVQAKVDNNFSYFTLNNDFCRDQLPNYPPLSAPFADFKTGSVGQTLFFQRIAKVETKFPLWTLGENSGHRQAVLCAEGIWKWRMFNFLQNQNQENIDDLIQKTVQYLTVKEDKRKFRVNVAKNLFKENESIDFTAELYNDNYELVNEPDVQLQIKSSDNKDYNFTFNKSGKSYFLKAGILPVGDYTFKGSVNYSGQTLTHSGLFSIQPIQQEQYETTADHSVLKALSQKFGGKTYYPGQLQSISQVLLNENALKPVIYTTSRTRSVINLKWLCGILIGLLGLEWFLRRYFGAY